MRGKAQKPMSTRSSSSVAALIAGVQLACASAPSPGGTVNADPSCRVDLVNNTGDLVVAWYDPGGVQLGLLDRNEAIEFSADCAHRDPSASPARRDRDGIPAAPAGGAVLIQPPGQLQDCWYSGRQRLHFDRTDQSCLPPARPEAQPRPRGFGPRLAAEAIVRYGIQGHHHRRAWEARW